MLPKSTAASGVICLLILALAWRTGGQRMLPRSPGKLRTMNWKSRNGEWGRSKKFPRGRASLLGIVRYEQGCDGCSGEDQSRLIAGSPVWVTL